MTDLLKAIRAELRPAIAKAVVSAAADPAVPILAPSGPDAAEAARVITDEALRAVALAPAVRHATNTEPWYQSRVTWGAIVSTAVPILALLGVATDAIDKDTAVSVGVALGTAIGGALTLYGRWRATKPIGA